MTANSVVNQTFQSESFVLQKGLNCPKPTIQCSWYTRRHFPVQTHDSRRWYTRRPFPVQTHDSMQLVHRRPFPVQTHDSRRLVHQTAFPCTNPRLKAIGTPDGLSLYKPTTQGDWYTRKPFPVPNPRLKAIGTPDGLFLYQIHDSMQLVHQKAFSCTKSTIQCSWYTRRPFPVPTPIIKLSKR